MPGCTELRPREESILTVHRKGSRVWTPAGPPPTHLFRQRPPQERRLCPRSSVLEGSSPRNHCRTGQTLGLQEDCVPLPQIPTSHRMSELKSTRGCFFHSCLNQPKTQIPTMSKDGDWTVQGLIRGHPQAVPLVSRPTEWEKKEFADHFF